MFFEISRETTNSFRVLLTQHGLMNADNFAKAKALPIINQCPIFMEILARCHTCKEGSYHLNQAVFDKLVETVKIIDMQNDDNDGLTALAASGLLNEETLELFAANPSAFNDESKFSDEGSDLKAIVQGIIDEQKSAFRPRI